MQVFFLLYASLFSFLLEARAGACGAMYRVGLGAWAHSGGSGGFRELGRNHSVGGRRCGAPRGDVHRAGVGGLPGVDGGGRGGGAPDTRSGDVGPRRAGHHVAAHERVRGLEEDAGAERRPRGVADGEEPVGGQGGRSRARGGRLHNQAVRHEGGFGEDQGHTAAVRAAGGQGPGRRRQAGDPGARPERLHREPGGGALGLDTDGVQDPGAVNAPPGASLHAGPDRGGRLHGLALPGQPLHRRTHQQAQGQGRARPVEAGDHTDRPERRLPGRPAGLASGGYPIGAKRERRFLPSLGFKARIFVALVGISSVTSLIIGLVLYYFAQDRLVKAENKLLEQRSRTANAGAQDFLESLRNPEDQTLPLPDTYAEELVQAVADPTGLEVLYVGPDGEPLAARGGFGDPRDPQEPYASLGLSEETLRQVAQSRGGEGRLVRGESSNYVAVWPLADSGGSVRGVMVYDVPQDQLKGTLAYLRYGILGAILTNVLLAGAASFLLTRQVTRPLSDTKDAAIRVASGDYATTVPVVSRDELGELARAFNYMAEEIEHYVGEIEMQKSRLEAVLEASPEALVTTDPGCRVTMANPAAARVLGIRLTDRGRTLEELGAPRGVLQCLREAAAHGVAVREVEVGDKAYWAYAAQMHRDGSDGEAKGEAGIILAVRDITEHRSLEKAKTAFVSDVSHELRTPLTTIQSAVGLLERARERLDPLEHRALELANGELRRIRGMVEELLTLAQLDAWQYQLEVGPTDLSRIVQTAMESVESKAARFGIEVNFDGAAEHRCVCDAQKLYQVFLNLLDNAIKYSDTGDRVDVKIEEDVLSLTVEVRDTGVGIPPEDLSQLFERFYRVDKDRSRATGGSGLGLAISRQIVEMHGGDISVESEVGVGSIFRVRLPKAPLTRSASHAL